MKTALVLGGTQFFGKRLVQNLVDSGVSVTIATRGRTADPFGDSVKRLVIDRESREMFASAVEAEDRWDVVFDQTCYSPQEVQDAVEILNGKVGHYVFTSTSAVYDYGVNRKEEEFKPEAYPIHLDTRGSYRGLEGYREAKRQAEAVLFQRASFPVTSVRFSIVVGPDDFTNRLQFHIDRVMNELPIGIPNPEVRNGFISSENAAGFLQWVAEKGIFGPLNATSPGSISLHELIMRVESIVGRKAKVMSDTEAEHRSPYALSGSLTMNPGRALHEGFSFSDLYELLDSLTIQGLEAVRLLSAKKMGKD